MTEALEIRTPHAEVSDIVRELAPAVDDLSIRLPCAQPLALGDWVRFTVRAADGSAVFEGLGRTERIEGDGPLRRVLLTGLSFDPRNEIMYERMLLARDAAEVTGSLDLQELDAELIRGPSRVKPPPPPPRDRVRDVSAIPRAKPATAPLRPSAPPPAPSGRSSASLGPTGKAASKPTFSKPRAGLAAPAPIPRTLPSSRQRPARPASGAPAQASKSSPPASAAQRRPSSVRPPAEATSTRDTVVSLRPEHKAAAPALRLAISAPMLAQARMLAPNLPKEVVPPRDDGPEEAVLRAALRLGLAALGALDDDEP